MFDHPIEILRYEEVRDNYNDRSKTLTHVASCYAQRTEAGGKENLYAGRIVHENEVVYSIRYRDGISAGMVVLDEGLRLRITATQEEGRRWRLHIRATKTDTGESHVDD